MATKSHSPNNLPQGSADQCVVCVACVACLCACVLQVPRVCCVWLVRACCGRASSVPCVLSVCVLSVCAVCVVCDLCVLSLLETKGDYACYICTDVNAMHLLRMPCWPLCRGCHQLSGNNKRSFVDVCFNSMCRWWVHESLLLLIADKT